MNALDAILLLTIVFFGVKGFIRGLLFEILTFAGLMAAYFLATREMGYLAGGISRHLNLPPALLAVVSFSLVFIFIVLMTRIIVGAISRLIKKTPAAWLDRGGGAVFGLFKGALMASLLAFLVSIMPLSVNWELQKKKSLFYRPVLPIAPAIFNLSVRCFPQTKSFCDEIREVLETQAESVKRSLMRSQLDDLEDVLEKELDVKLEKDTRSNALK
jgi:membrane protein required for colicin V production